MSEIVRPNKSKWPFLKTQNYHICSPKFEGGLKLCLSRLFLRNMIHLGHRKERGFV